MERSRVTLAVLISVLLFSQRRIYGEEIEVKVRPGDNITLICDRPLTRGIYIAWIRNCSHEHQPSLIIDFTKLYEMSENFPRFYSPKNPNTHSFDLHITNITVSDLGLYYCAEFERKVYKDENGIIHSSDVYHYGNQTTRLSLTEPVPSTLPEVFELNCNCLTLLLSVCSVCVLLSSLLSAACVYCICRAQTTEFNAEIPKENVFKMDPTEKHQCKMCRTGKFCLHSEVTYRLLPEGHHYAKM